MWPTNVAKQQLHGKCYQKLMVTLSHELQRDLLGRPIVIATLAKLGIMILLDIILTLNL